VVVAIAASVALALAPSPPVRTFGTIRQLVDLHDDASKVVLADVVSLPGTYGLGSLSQLRGEVTILDGVTSISYRPVLPGESPRVVSGPDIGEEAGFLVTANVAPERWRQVKIDVPFSSETLEPLLHSSARDHAKALVSLQDHLGAMQDAEVVERWLRGALSNGRGDAFVVGELVGLERARKERVCATWETKWQRAARGKLRRWAR